MGVFQSKLLCLVVHQLDKRIFRAADVIGKSNGCICTGGQRNAVEQITDADGFALFEAGTGCLSLHQRGDDVVGHGDGFVHILNVFHGHQYGHDLGHGCRIHPVVSVTLRQNGVVLHIQQNGVQTVDVRAG